MRKGFIRLGMIIALLFVTAIVSTASPIIVPPPPPTCPGSPIPGDCPVPKPNPNFVDSNQN